MALDMKYPTPLPDEKGWGPGWTHEGDTCPATRTNLVPHSIFQGGVREEIVELVDLIVAEAERRGFIFHDGWSWGFGCRATKGGSGTTPSFHSWGLALDVNAPENVFGGAESASDIATKNRWLVGLMADYGFLWLGPPIGDWMHFHFTGDRGDAARLTAKAREDFATEEGDDVNLDKYIDGERKYREKFKASGNKDQGEPPSDWPSVKKAGWNSARFASNNPKPSAAPSEQ